MEKAEERIIGAPYFRQPRGSRDPLFCQRVSRRNRRLPLYLPLTPYLKDVAGPHGGIILIPVAVDEELEAAQYDRQPAANI